MSSQVALTFFTRGARLLASLVASIITARALGPEGRGEYFLVITISALILQFANLGLASSNTYLVARNPSLLPSLLGNSVVVSFVVGGLAAVGVAVWLAVTSVFPIDPLTLAPIIVLAPVTLFYLLGSNLLVGIGRLTAYNLIEGGSTVFVAMCIGVAAVATANPFAVILASVIGWSACAAVLAAVLAPTS